MNFLKRIHSKNSKVLVFDGATGTSFQKLDLTPDDFGGAEYEGCNEHLVLTRPDVVEQVHNDYLKAGCDVIETNTFGAASIVLSEYSLEDKAYEINKKAALIAKKAASIYSTPEKPRYVAGSIGPTTKIPTLGHISFAEMRDSFKEQVRGLIDGGVDLFIVETCQDVLQIKSALQAIEFHKKDLNQRIPIMVSVTIETTGTMLIGSDIAAVVSILEPFQIDILGLNCATGPEQMKSHIKYLHEHSPFVISCIPNAGLPENIGGKAHYRLTPIELKMQLMHFVEDLGVRVIGGCCGTTPEHIKQLSDLSSELLPTSRICRQYDQLKIIDSQQYYVPSAASIYTTTKYDQDTSILIIGERLNASGSKKVRTLLQEEDWDGLVSIAKSQVNENSHILDVNVDYVGRDGVSDMKELVSRLVTNINIPLMIDSTESDKMESGLMVSGGKNIINSTNYEDGDDRFYSVLNLAKSYGAGIVIGTIDEDGMARTSSKKVSIAKRAYKDILGNGLPAYEIFYDPLALPISTGIEEDRKNASETIKAIKEIKRIDTNVHIILGISNISFGLSPAARIALNSVFLDECVKAGLDTAIVSPSKILPLNKIGDKEKQTCLDLIYDSRKFDKGVCTYDPLTTLTSLFEGITSKESRSSQKELINLPIEQRLIKHIIDGEKVGLDECLENALTKYKPLEIINTYLLEGMKVVGELFGSGQMQLPFVLQSAQTMKSAVSFLEPFMEKSDTENTSKGKFLIATVKGDVHDIGKNLVDIILSNNGYEVINLGIKQDVESIINAYKEYKPDCIAMSGLLVKSTAFMKDNLSAFNDNGITIPVILGGAALTPRFVSVDCSNAYNGAVIYGKDAFTDLKFMDSYMSALKNSKWTDSYGFSDGQNERFKINLIESNQDINVTEEEGETEKSKSNSSNEQMLISNTRSSSVSLCNPSLPPFLGTKVVKSTEINLSDIIKYIDKNALYSGQWQFKRQKGLTKEEYQKYLLSEAEPIFDYWINQIQEFNLLHPSFVYGYFPCSRTNNSLNIYSFNKSDILGSFKFPRQKSGNKYCISDFFSDPVNNKPVDFIPMQAVTMGEYASEYSQKLFKEDKYQEYLFFHGLSVQLAEALAEYVHSLIRVESGFLEEEPSDIRGVLAQRYRGCRYSFGYPACPNVSDSYKQLEWLDAQRIGLFMDESEQLYPEQSTTAIVSLHPDAKYFSA